MMGKKAWRSSTNQAGGRVLAKGQMPFHDRHAEAGWAGHTRVSKSNVQSRPTGAKKHWMKNLKSLEVEDEKISKTNRFIWCNMRDWWEGPIRMVYF